MGMMCTQLPVRGRETGLAAIIQATTLLARAFTTVHACVLCTACRRPREQHYFQCAMFAADRLLRILLGHIHGGQLKACLPNPLHGLLRVTKAGGQHPDY
jgi:hypothetical protein